MSTEIQPESSSYQQSSADGGEVYNIKNENEEIEQLQLQTEEKPKIIPEDDDRIPTIKFQCDSCGMLEMVHYYGKDPPFVYGVKFLENSYVMRDPFQPPPPRWKSKAEFFITLGSECSICQKVVCKDPDCSFFYTTTLCIDCARKSLKVFPVEAQAKFRKQVANINR